MTLNRFIGLWPVLLVLLQCNLDSVAPAENLEHYKEDVVAHFGAGSQAVDRLVRASGDPGSERTSRTFLRLYQQVGYNPQREALYQGGPRRRRHSVHRSVHERSSPTGGQELPTVGTLENVLKIAVGILDKCISYERDLNTPGKIHFSGVDLPKLLQALKPKLEKGSKLYDEMKQVHTKCVNDLKLQPEQPVPVQFMSEYANFYQNAYLDSWIYWFVKLVEWQRFFNKFVKDKIVSYESQIVEDTESLNKLKQEAQEWERSLSQAFDILTSNGVLTHALIDQLEVFDKKFTDSWDTVEALLKVLNKPKEANSFSGENGGAEGHKQQQPDKVEPVSAEIQDPPLPTTKDPRYFFQKKRFFIPAVIGGSLFAGWWLGLHHEIPKWVGWGPQEEYATTAGVNASNSTITDKSCDKSTHQVKYLTIVMVVLVVLTLLSVGILLKDCNNGTTSDLERGEASHKSQATSTGGSTTTGTDTSLPLTSTPSSNATSGKAKSEAKKPNSPGATSTPVPSKPRVQAPK